MKDFEERESFVEKWFMGLAEYSKSHPDLFSEKEKKIIERFPYHKKEGVKFLESIFIVESCFTDIENFDLEYEGRMIRCFLVKLNDRTSSDWCIKASKVTHPGRTLFLGQKGIDILHERFPEKIVGKDVFSFSCKRSPNPNIIPGISLEDDGYYKVRYLDHPSNIATCNIIAIFKEIPKE